MSFRLVTPRWSPAWRQGLPPAEYRPETAPRRSGLNEVKGGWKAELGTSGRGGQQDYGRITSRRPEARPLRYKVARFLPGQGQRVPVTPAFSAWEAPETSFHLFQRLDPTGIQNPAIEIQLFQVFDRPAGRQGQAGIAYNYRETLGPTDRDVQAVPIEQELQSARASFTMACAH